MANWLCGKHVWGKNACHKDAYMETTYNCLNGPSYWKAMKSHRMHTWEYYQRGGKDFSEQK